MNKKLVFALVLVALVAITNAKPQGGDPINIDNGENQINIVDGPDPIHIVDGADQEDSYARGGGNNK